MMKPPDDTAELLARAGRGDARALGDLYERHQERLRRMIYLRLDVRLRGRLDPSDVLQETYLELSRSLADYLRNPTTPFFIWLRFIAARKLHALHRHHLGRRMRNASLEVPIYQNALPEVSSQSLAAGLLGRESSPSQAALRAELQLRVREALDQMPALDREVLALRHFEQLSNNEVAEVLGISKAAASNRYMRALKRLRAILADLPGGDEDPRP
ncbi:MAG TPA: sigma-70 family RNA polymerase sigma factor [Pirellulales bacterium]